MKLYDIAWEYDKTVAPLNIAYGNGFDRLGSAYFSYLLSIRPAFKGWVEEKYPEVRCL